MPLTNFPSGVTSFGVPLPSGGLPVIGAGNAYWFVSSVAGDSGNPGTSDAPFATLAAACSNTALAVSDVIVVLPGHTETVAAAGGITLSTAGVQVIGLGTGGKRPALTFSTSTAASCLVTGASARIENIIGVSGIDGLANPFHVQAADVSLDIEWQDSSSTVEAARAILTTAAADRFRVKLTYRGQTAGDACVNAVRLVGCDGGDIEIDAYGKASIAWVEFRTTACTDISVRGNVYTSGTTDGSKTVIDTVTGSTWAAELFDMTAGAPFSGGSGSALAKDDMTAITDALYGTAGVASWPSAARYANAVSIAEVLAYIQDAVNAGTGGTALGTNKSLVDALGCNGTAAQTIGAGSVLGANGSCFVVQKQLASSAILSASAVDLTAVAAGGDVLIEAVAFETDGTGIATSSGVNLSVLKSGGNGGLTVATAALSTLTGANKSLPLSSWAVAPAAFPVTVTSGQKLQIQSSTGPCTGAGVVTITMKCRRVAAGATLAAA